VDTGVPVRVLVLGVVGVRLPLPVLPRLWRPFNDDVLTLIPPGPTLELSRDVVDVDRPVLVLLLTLALSRRSLDGGGSSDARRCGRPPRVEGVGVARAAAVNDEDTVDAVDSSLSTNAPPFPVPMLLVLLIVELRRLRWLGLCGRSDGRREGVGRLLRGEIADAIGRGDVAGVPPRGEAPGVPPRGEAPGAPPRGDDTDAPPRGDAPPRVDVVRIRGLVEESGVGDAIISAFASSLFSFPLSFFVDEAADTEPASTSPSPPSSPPPSCHCRCSITDFVAHYIVSRN
jgi:hypothetical protein